MVFYEKLSSREFQVLELIGSGSTNSEITETLGITKSTAKTHLRNIYYKTDFHNRTDLNRWNSTFSPKIEFEYEARYPIPRGTNCLAGK